VYGDNNLNITYQGTTANFFPVRNYVMASGFAFTDQDVAAYNHVVVIGSDLANTLLVKLSSLSARASASATLRFASLAFSSHGTGPGGVNQDDLALVP